MAVATPARPVRTVLHRIAAPLLVLVAVLTLPLLDRAGQPGTTYASVSRLAGRTGLTTGMLLLSVGLVVSLTSELAVLGWLTLAAGVVWFAPDWVGWEQGPALLRSVGAVTAPFLACLLLHLAQVATSRRSLRALPVVVYAATAVIVATSALVRDPFLDADCWSNCTANVWLVHADPGLARAIGTVLRGIWAVTAALALVLGLRRLTSRPVPRLGLDLPLVLAVTCAAVVEVGFGLVAALRPETADDALFVRLQVLRGIAWGLLACAVLGVALAARTRRRRLLRLVHDLRRATGEGSFAAALGESLADPTLEVLYPIDGGRAYVDATGRPAREPTPGDHRVASALMRRGQTVAVVRHDPASVPAQVFEGQLGDAARLAIENERLAAELRARLLQLALSRSRIVAAGDARRRRLERDLHDGAQQRVLALTFDLRRARSAAVSSEDTCAVECLERSLSAAEAALDELRDLAHGIYPAILGEGGLLAALRAAADTAPVAVVLDSVSRERFADAVEMAAYGVVTEAIVRAAASGAESVALTIRHAGNEIVVDVHASMSLAPSLAVADRVGALGGSVTSTGHGLRAVIPCGS